MPLPVQTYNTLEEIVSRKEQLRQAIDKETVKISGLWREITVPQPASSKGELIANLVGNSVTAIDAFLLARKLIKNYGWLLNWKKKRKR